jgi:hypothetical protein
MSDVRHLAAAAVVATLSLIGISSCDDGGKPATQAPSAASTPLSSFDTEHVRVIRDAFCSQIGPGPVAEALGGDAASSASYNNGERARISSRVRDVAHEFDCTWVAADGTTAEAWVFAPPVTPERGRLLARTAAREAGPGCTTLATAPRFGSPSAAVRCQERGRLETSFHGLFGDAWLSCSLAAPAADTDPDALLERAGRWCVTVVEAAAARG